MCFRHLWWCRVALSLPSAQICLHRCSRRPRLRWWAPARSYTVCNPAPESRDFTCLHMIYQTRRNHSAGVTWRLWSRITYYNRNKKQTKPHKGWATNLRNAADLLNVLQEALKDERLIKTKRVKKQKALEIKTKSTQMAFWKMILTWIFCPKWKRWTVYSLQRKKNGTIQACSDMRMSK